MYEVINEELKLEACGIGDLTMDVVSGMLRQWDDGSCISTLTLFYLPKRDTVVLNRDNKGYETYREFAEAYLMCEEQKREEIRSKFQNDEKNSMREEINVLDSVLDYRRNSKELFRLRHQPMKDTDSGLSISLMNEIIKDTDDHYLSMYKAFQYGVMQGKRLERNKKKTIRNSLASTKDCPKHKEYLAKISIRYSAF